MCVTLADIHICMLSARLLVIAPSRLVPELLCMCIYFSLSSSLLHSMQVMDYGYPQFTEAKILSEFIKTDAYKMEVFSPGHSSIPASFGWSN